MKITLTENKLRSLIKESIIRYLNEDIDNSKYVITAQCDPYNAKFHYHHQQVLKRDMTTPVYWIQDDNYGCGYTKEEAMRELDGYADGMSDDVNFEDNDSIKSLMANGIDTSWYKGEGWYENGTLVYQHGEMDLRDDSMLYRIEPMSEIKNGLNEIFNWKRTKNDETPKGFDYTENCVNSDFTIVGKNNKYNLINKNGQIISKQWFEEIIDLRNGFVTVCLNGQWNLINKQGKYVLEQWSDEDVKFIRGKIVVALNGSHYTVDKNGKLSPFYW